MTVRHPLLRDDVRMSQLRDELSTRLGRRVELVAQRPTEDEPGVLIVEDPDTAEWLDVDPAVVAEVVAAHTPPPARSREEEALAELDAASSPATKFEALRRYLVGRVEDDRVRREQARQSRVDLRRRIRDQASVSGQRAGPLGGRRRDRPAP